MSIESNSPLVTPDDVERAAALITAHVRKTPVIEHDGVVLKLELLQHAGSFKTRGAFNRVLSAGELPPSGVITASGGNHGAALANVARGLGITAEVFIPSTSPALKRSNIERFGAAVTVIEGYYDDAQREASLRQACTGALMVHPFDHVDTVAGQGTMSRELERQVIGFDTLIIAAGGGGFLAGQAAWLTDRVKIVCVEPETSQCVRAALAAGECTPVSVSGLGSDSLGAGQVGEVPWSIIRHYVDEAVTIDAEAMRDAQRSLWNDLRLVAEPGGAAAYAAIRSGAYKPSAGERVVVAVCGSNCDPNDVM